MTRNMTYRFFLASTKPLSPFYQMVQVPSTALYSFIKRTAVGFSDFAVLFVFSGTLSYFFDKLNLLSRFLFLTVASSHRYLLPIIFSLFSGRSLFSLNPKYIVSHCYDAHQCEKLYHFYQVNFLSECLLLFSCHTASRSDIKILAPLHYYFLQFLLAGPEYIAVVFSDTA